MKKTILIILLIILLVLIFVFNSQNKEVSSDTIKIGVILPLSGNAAQSGDDSLAAIEIAKEDLSDKYPNVEIIIEDSEFSPSKTISAYNKLVDIDGVPAVIGAINSSAVVAVTPVAQNRQVVFLSPAGAASQMDDFVYKNSHEASKEGGLVAEFSFNVGDRTAAILYMDNDFGEIEKDSFVETFERLGGEIVSIESFDISGSTDYRTQLTKIGAEGPDSILIVSLGGLVGTASRQVRELKIDSNLYGIYTTEASDLLEAGGDSLEGLVYSFPLSTDNQTKKQKKFVNDFRQKTGEDPQLISYNAYDLYSMLVPIVAECSSNPICIENDIGSRIEFSGIGGTVKIDEENKLDRKFYFRTIQDGEVVEVK